MFLRLTSYITGKTPRLGLLPRSLIARSHTLSAKINLLLRLLHKGESRCCFRDSASVTYGGMLPSDLTLSALRFILSAKSRQSCQDCEAVDFCNSLLLQKRTQTQRGSALTRYNNLEPATYRNGVVSGKSDFHVDISKSPRGEFLFPR